MAAYYNSKSWGFTLIFMLIKHCEYILCLFILLTISITVIGWFRQSGDRERPNLWRFPYQRRVPLSESELVRSNLDLERSHISSFPRFRFSFSHPAMTVDLPLKGSEVDSRIYTISLTKGSPSIDRSRELCLNPKNGWHLQRQTSCLLY